MLPANRKDQSRVARKGVIARALERLAKNLPANPEDKAALRNAAATPAPRDEEYFIVQRCAVTGERFKTFFTRRPDGKFVAKAQEKIEADFSAFVADDGGTAPSANIRAEDIAQMPEEPCPCCGRRLDYQHVRCGTCRELVCTGLSYKWGGDYTFVCHESCGGHGLLTGERISSYAAERVEAPRGKPAVAQERRTALPSGKAKLLGKRR